MMSSRFKLSTISGSIVNAMRAGVNNRSADSRKLQPGWISTDLPDIAPGKNNRYLADLLLTLWTLALTIDPLIVANFNLERYPEWIFQISHQLDAIYIQRIYCQRYGR